MFVLKVCDEFGIQDSVTVLDIIDSVDGDNSSKHNENHDNWEPNAYLFSGKDSHINPASGLSEGRSSLFGLSLSTLSFDYEQTM